MSDSSIKKTSVVGAKSANCAIKNTATENAMSKSTQSIFEKALASNNGKGLSLNEMSQSLKGSGVKASSSLEQGNNADHSFSNKQYVDVTDSDGKTYRLWDRNKDGNLSASDFNNQLSGTASLLSNICSGSNCAGSGCLGKSCGSGSKDSSSDCSGGDCSGNDSSSSCPTGNCSTDNTSSCPTGNCSTNDSEVNGNNNTSNVSSKDNSSSGLVGKVKDLLIAMNPELAKADNNSTDNNSTNSTNNSSSQLDSMANAYISVAKLKLGDKATDSNVLNYVSTMLKGGSSGAATTALNNTTNTTGTTNFTQTPVAA